MAEPQDLLAQVEQTQPDIVLLNWEIPGLADLLDILRAICCPLKVIACSECREARQEALAAGVSAFVSKEEFPILLANTLRLVGGLSPYFAG